MNALDSLMKIYQFYQKSIAKSEQGTESAALDAIFKEFRDGNSQKLTEDDLEIMKQEVPMEILIKYAGFLNRYCRCLLKIEGEGMRRAALDLLDYAESLDPEEYLDVFIDIIDLYCEFNFFHKAIGICQKLSMNENLEDKSVILMRMGILFGKMKDTPKEIETYKKVLELNPGNKKARFRLSEIYETEGLYSDALRILADKEHHTVKLQGDEYDSAMMEADDEEDQIYLSEDDEGALGKRNPSSIPQVKFEAGDIKLEESEHHRTSAFRAHKVDNLIKDIKNEATLNLKTKRRMMNIVELNEQFFMNVQKTIDDITLKYNLDILLLEFKQCELSLKSVASEADFKCIRKALRLEQRKLAFRESIYQLLLNESKGKIRSTFQGFETEDPQFRKELNYLFIFKRKKHADQEFSRIDTMFKESKNKSCVAKKLAHKLVAKMKTIPDYIGFDKFVDIVDLSMKQMYAAKKYLILSQTCDMLMKISKAFEGYPKFQVNYHYYGFLANCRVDNYEKAYIFFRVISKHLIADDPDSDEPALDRRQSLVEGAKQRISEDLRAQFKSLFKAYSQTDINKVCFCMMNHLFNEFYQQESSHRIFFQKFQKQYERIVGVSKFVNLICANNYIMSGSYGSAREWLSKNGDLDSNPLSNFLMGYISLIESTNRNNDNKIEMIHTAFEYFEEYKSLSSNAKLPEVYYNMGRAFSHLSMTTAALKLFAKAKAAVEDRLLQYRQLVRTQAIQTGKRVDEEKWADFDKDYRKRHFYYESCFNEIVWHSKLQNKASANSLINSTFSKAN